MPLVSFLCPNLMTVIRDYSEAQIMVMALWWLWLFGMKLNFHINVGHKALFKTGPRQPIQCHCLTSLPYSHHLKYHLFTATVHIWVFLMLVSPCLGCSLSEIHREIQGIFQTQCQCSFIWESLCDDTSALIINYRSISLGKYLLNAIIFICWFVNFKRI